MKDESGLSCMPRSWSALNQGQKSHSQAMAERRSSSARRAALVQRALRKPSWTRKPATWFACIAANAAGTFGTISAEPKFLTCVMLSESNEEVPNAVQTQGMARAYRHGFLQRLHAGNELTREMLARSREQDRQVQRASERRSPPALGTAALRRNRKGPLSWRPLFLTCRYKGRSAIAAELLVMMIDARH